MHHSIHRVAHSSQAPSHQIHKPFICASCRHNFPDEDGNFFDKDTLSGTQHVNESDERVCTLCAKGSRNEKKERFRRKWHNRNRSLAKQNTKVDDQAVDARKDDDRSVSNGQTSSAKGTTPELSDLSSSKIVRLRTTPVALSSIVSPTSPSDGVIQARLCRRMNRPVLSIDTAAAQRFGRGSRHLARLSRSTTASFDDRTEDKESDEYRTARDSQSQSRALDSDSPATLNSSVENETRIQTHERNMPTHQELAKILDAGEVDFAQSTKYLNPRHLHPLTGVMIPKPVPHPPHGLFSRELPVNHGIPDGPSNLQLMGYAGLEFCPFLGRMIDTPSVHNTYTQFYRYDDESCLAGIIYADPRANKSREAWLYVRKLGMVRWERDYLAERGGMRHFVYMSEEPGWNWVQVLGDALDARAHLNMWVKLKIDV